MTLWFQHKKDPTILINVEDLQPKGRHHTIRIKMIRIASGDVVYRNVREDQFYDNVANQIDLRMIKYAKMLII